MKRGTPRHPKLMALSDELRCGRPTAVGYVELLWHFTAEFAPRGDVGKFADKAIEAALDWRRSNGKLVAALVKTGLLDEDPAHRLLVHDWKDHADDAVRKKLVRAGLTFAIASKETGETTAENVGNPAGQNPPALARALPEPEPKPEGAPRPEARERVSFPIGGNGALPGWNEFNTEYPPRRLDGEPALRAFVARQDETAAILAGLRVALKSQQWADADGKYVPKASRFISEGIYKDLGRFTRKASSGPRVLTNEEIFRKV
jgi:hypothetical protein